jgi:hypothetical protein
MVSSTMALWALAVGPIRAGDRHQADRALVEGPRQGVIDQGQVAGHARHEFDNRRAARRHGGGLHIGLKMITAFGIHLVENRADHMEVGADVGADDAKEQPHFFTRIGAQDALAGECAVSAVEDHIGWPLVNRLLHVKALQAIGTVTAGGVKIALHYIVFAVNLAHAILGLDQNHAVHAVGHMHADRRGGAVVDVQAGIKCLEGKAGLVAGRDQGLRRTAAGPVTACRSILCGSLLPARFFRCNSTVSPSRTRIILPGTVPPLERRGQDG